MEEVAGGIIILPRLLQGGGGQFYRHFRLVQRSALPVLRLEVHVRAGGHPFPLRLPFSGAHFCRSGTLALLEEGARLGCEAGFLHILPGVLPFPVPGEVLCLRQRLCLGGFPRLGIHWLGWLSRFSRFCGLILGQGGRFRRPDGVQRSLLAGLGFLHRLLLLHRLPIGIAGHGNVDLGGTAGGRGLDVQLGDGDRRFRVAHKGQRVRLLLGTAGELFHGVGILDVVVRGIGGTLRLLLGLFLLLPIALGTVLVEHMHQLRRADAPQP